MPTSKVNGPRRSCYTRSHTCVEEKGNKLLTWMPVCHQGFFSLAWSVMRRVHWSHSAHCNAYCQTLVDLVQAEAEMKLAYSFLHSCIYMLLWLCRKNFLAESSYLLLRRLLKDGGASSYREYQSHHLTFMAWSWGCRLLNPPLTFSTISHLTF